MPEEPEDMWHAYNLIAKGDNVRSTTIRKVYQIKFVLNKRMFLNLLFSRYNLNLPRAPQQVIVYALP